MKLRKDKRKIEKDAKKILIIDPENLSALQALTNLNKKEQVRCEVKDKRLINSGFEHDLVYSP
jgi:hypothetical protein